MTLTSAELALVRRIKFPAVWAHDSRTPIGRIYWLAEPDVEIEGVCHPLRTDQTKIREFNFTTVSGKTITISIGAPSDDALENSHVISAKSVDVGDDLVDLTKTGTWKKHPGQVTFSDLASKKCEILASWSVGINYNSDKGGFGGLRTPQSGALHAIAAHWSVEAKPATIVMPTGTGKTEVMVATTLATCCTSLLVVVPSDALRTQTAGKFKSLGVLRGIGVVPPQMLYPIVGVLEHIPKDESDLSMFSMCNVVVSTISALSGASTEVLKTISDLCSHLFFDEAHHAPAETWKNLREIFSKKPILQFTATPFRQDGKRLDGRIIYNYPLSKAQEEGYFQAINFRQVWEWDDDLADAAIAEAAVAQLKDDFSKNFNHILMARANSIERAQYLCDHIYAKYTDLHPVLIHNKVHDRNRILDDIKGVKHSIIICVDMLGEGFDLPQLKIAALHDAHRSLGITLQFAGRFTRTSGGIGTATVVANLADEKISESLEELYSEDADWNRLLPDLSYTAIRPEQRMSDFLGGLQNSAPVGAELLTVAAVEMRTSATVYHCNSFHPGGFSKGIPKGSEIISWWRHPGEGILLFVVKRLDPIEWARVKDIVNTTFDLYIAFYDSANNLLFINSSARENHLSLAKAIGTKVAQIKGEVVFRVLDRIERIMFYNAGLLRNSAGGVRFQMFAGFDVANAIDPTQQQGNTKSNLFGAGYEDGNRVTIGCSQKGSVWSQQTSSLPSWREWCINIGKKLKDSSISTTSYLDNTLIPERVKELPPDRPICIEWPSEFFEHILSGFDITPSGAPISWLDCDIMIERWGKMDYEYSVNYPDETKSIFEGCLKEDGSFELREKRTTTYITDRRKSGNRSLESFFAEHPPLLRFPDGAELFGTTYIRPRKSNAFHYPVDDLEAKDWSTVDITIESKWKNVSIPRLNSVQEFVIQQLLSDSRFKIVIDDDDSGEAADVIGIIHESDNIELHFFHCKYSSSPKPGSRVDDIFVVCGQAQKGVNWTHDLDRLVKHIKHREVKRGVRNSRFEKGSLKDLLSLERASTRVRVKSFITVVQPGISKASFQPEHSAIFGATSLFLRQRLGTALKVWVSK